MRIFRGYIGTNSKRSISKFKDVPDEDLISLEKATRMNSYAGVLASDIILVDLDDAEAADKLFSIIEERDVHCEVRQTDRGKHFYFLNTDVEKCETKATLALGLKADIKVGSSNSYAVLKHNGKTRDIVRTCEELDPLPGWLHPVKGGKNFSQLEEGERNNDLFKYIITLTTAGLTQDEVKETIRIINRYIMENPLTDRELENIIRPEAFENLTPAFFKDKTFLHDVFGEYMKNAFNIKRINGVLHIYRDGIYVKGSRLIQNSMVRVLKRIKKNQQAEVMNYLENTILEDTPQASAYLIAFKNCIYNLKTDRTEEFTPNIVITNQLNCNYNPQASAEAVDTVLNNLSVGDTKIRMLLEEVAGYTFFRRNELRKAFIFVAGPSSGKSTYLNMLGDVLGSENTVALDLKELGSRFKTGEIHGKLAILGDDIGDEFIPDSSVFKKLTSGDKINAEFKGEKPFDFKPYAKPIFSANSIPRIKDKGGGVRDRLIIVPFNAHFEGENKDTYIIDDLNTEEARDYFGMLALKGLKRLLKQDHFTESLQVKKAKAEYDKVNNPILIFFEEYGDVLEKSTDKVYMDYTAWCGVGGYTSMSKIEFGKKVCQHFDCQSVTKRENGKLIRVFSQK